jgi:hypothetical protein
MNSSNNRYLIPCLVIALVACLCLSAITVTGVAGFLIWNQQNPGASISPGEATPAVTISPQEIERQMDEIQDQVIRLRGLAPAESVQRTLLTPEELQTHVTENFFDEYTVEDARDDALVLAAFGLLAPDFNLHEFYQQLYSEQVAGFYDDETKEMFVVKDGDFSGPERLTYAHEYNHALQDQTYNIQEGLNYSQEACEEDSERCIAIQALLEGDSTMLELQWFQQYATQLDQQQIAEFYADLESPVFDSSPDFMQEDFLFPYSAGYDFVQGLYDEGGWEAIERVYQNLPQSSEQILHPERYPADRPVRMEAPDLSTQLGADWRELDRGVMGEWYTYLILALGEDHSARLDESRARRAAEGWGGDAYVVYSNGQSGQTVFALTYRWDTEGDADEFVQAFELYATGRFGKPATGSGEWRWESEQGVTLLEQDGEITTWLYASDRESFEKIQAP